MNLSYVDLFNISQNKRDQVTTYTKELQTTKKRKKSEENTPIT